MKKMAKATKIDLEVKKPYGNEHYEVGKLIYKDEWMIDDKYNITLPTLVATPSETRFECNIIRTLKLDENLFINWIDEDEKKGRCIISTHENQKFTIKNKKGYFGSEEVIYAEETKYRCSASSKSFLWYLKQLYYNHYDNYIDKFSVVDRGGHTPIYVICEYGQLYEGNTGQKTKPAI